MDNVLNRVRELVPLVAERAEDTERERGAAAELFEQLGQSGCLRMLAPRSHGGLEMSLPDVLAVVTALAAADGSVGWSVGQAAMAQLVLTYFPATTIDEVYAAGPDVVGAGAVAPKGKAIPAAGGWRISGQWPFVSGVDRSSWVYLQCVVFGSDDEPALTGTPPLRLMLFPIEQVRRIDTWRAVGLRGTGSHDVRARGFCPSERSASVLDTRSTFDRPAYRIPTVEYGGLLVAAAAVGIASAAIDDVLVGANRRPAFSHTSMSDSPLFCDQLGETYLAIRCANALLDTQAVAAQQAASSGTVLSAAERGTLRGTATTVVAAARQVVNTAYLLGGGPALYDSSPLQRRLRDIHTASQHAAAGRHSYALLGEELLGRQPELLRMRTQP